MKKICSALLVLLTGVTGQVRAESPYVADDAIVAKIRELTDSTSVALPPFKLAGEGVAEWQKKYGQPPQRRDYGNKIVYAPDRGAGMYCGMNHGAPHRLNDAWEYHLGSNTWHLLFAPDINFNNKEAKTPEWIKANVVLKDGYLQTRRGGLMNSVHTWDGLAYDPVLKCMLWADIVEADYTKKYAEAMGLQVDDVLKQLKPGSKLWMYDPKDGRWYKQTGEAPHPKMNCMGGTLVYIPELKKSIWLAAQWNESGMWAYDSAANTWTELKPNGGKSVYHDKEDNFPDAEMQAAYSSKHQKIVAVKDKRTWLYDIKKNEWSKACDDPANNAHDANTVFAYDSVNDVYLLLQPREKSLRAYRIDTNKWETLQPKGAGVSTGGAGYFDPAHNCFVVYERDRMWAYRFKQAVKP